ncbi:MAG: hypothetical protein ACMG6E_04580, partial [Candidatus Roizmanbacteria bacterium]
MEDNPVPEVATLKSIIGRLEQRIKPKKLVAPLIIGLAAAASPMVLPQVAEAIVERVHPELAQTSKGTEGTVSDFHTSYKKPEVSALFGPSEYVDVAKSITLAESLGESAAFSYHGSTIQVIREPKSSGLPESVTTFIQGHQGRVPSLSTDILDKIPSTVGLQAVLEAEKVVVTADTLVTHNKNGTYNIYSLRNNDFCESVRETDLNAYSELLTKEVDPSLTFAFIDTLSKNSISPSEARHLFKKAGHIRSTVSQNSQQAVALDKLLISVFDSSATANVRNRLLTIFIDFYQTLSPYEGIDATHEAGEMIEHYMVATNKIDNLEEIWKSKKNFFEFYLQKNGDALPMRMVIEVIEEFSIKKYTESEAYLFLEKFAHLNAENFEFKSTKIDVPKESPQKRALNLMLTSNSPISALDKYQFLHQKLKDTTDYETFVETFKLFDYMGISVDETVRVYTDFHLMENDFRLLGFDRISSLKLLLKVPTEKVRVIFPVVQDLDAKYGINQWDKPFIVDLLLPLYLSNKEITPTIDANGNPINERPQVQPVPSVIPTIIGGYLVRKVLQTDFRSGVLT